MSQLVYVVADNWKQARGHFGEINPFWLAGYQGAGSDQGASWQWNYLERFAHDHLLSSSNLRRS